MNWIFRFAAASCLATLLATLSSVAQGQTLTTMIHTGASSNRVDVVFLGDGYTASQIDTDYVDHVNDGMDYFFNGFQNPYPRYKNFFNVHRINLISNDSGADKPPLGIFRDTALDASYWWDGTTERLLSVNSFKASVAAVQAIAGTEIDLDIRVVVVNDTKYGGEGGFWSVYAGGNFNATEIAVHEIGHSFASLADEYESGLGTYTGPEPPEANVTKTPGTPTFPGKWDRWVGYIDPDHPQIGPVGYYEGGRYYETGIYRPTIDSKMRSLNDPFNAISRESIISQIYARVSPLDAFLDNVGTLIDPTSIWVDTVDPAVIEVSWFLDGVLLEQEGELIDLTSLPLAPGDYQLEAVAYDGILNHSFSGSSLDWWRLPDSSALRQSVNWNFRRSVIPEPSGIFLLTTIAAGFPLRRKNRSSRF